MQSIPTTISTMKPIDPTVNYGHSPPLSRFRPYNHYPSMGAVTPSSLSPTSNGIGMQTGGPYKSAFKPVAKRPIFSNAPAATTTNTYATEPSYFNTPNAIVTSSSSYNRYSPNQIQSRIQSIPYNPPYRGLEGPSSEVTKDIQNVDATLNNVEIPNDMPAQHSNLEKLLRKPATEYEKTQATHTEKNKNENRKLVDNVFHWDTLLPLVPDPQTRVEVSVLPKKINTRKRRLGKIAVSKCADVNDSDVPIIDLTSGEDLDDCIPCSVIELNKTPPLDINGNEILVSTNTETLPTIKAQDSTTQAQQVNQMPLLPESIHIEKIAKNSINSTVEHSDFPILFANLTQNGFRMPPKEQIKFVNKCNRYMGYVRRYNGFRLFVQRNYLRAQAHAPRSEFTKTFIQNILLRWWSTMSADAKEQYVRMANISHTKKSDSTPSNANYSDNDEPNVSIIPIFNGSHPSTSKASDVSVNVNENTEAGAATVNNNAVTTLHSPVNSQ
ncbi:uncharacterized protein LOC129578038 isoform X2 [Sitodiplosis mosellana]|nr:uncharacterized protein LOC129578038 isoform X2 [Sitodiplosis mosellana]